MTADAQPRDSQDCSGDPSVQPLRPWSSTWVQYYDQYSRRRHQLGGYRRLRALAKRRRRVELVSIVCASAGVLVLVSVFYAILNR